MRLTLVPFGETSLDTFDSGPNAASWVGGGKSMDVYVLTKTSNEWYCENKKCDGTQLPNVVVNDAGDLNEECTYCLTKTRRTARTRKPSRKKREEEDE